MRATLENWLYKAPSAIRTVAINAVGYGQRYKRFGGEFKSFHTWLLQSQYWPPERIREFQLERLRNVITVAYSQVPYWKPVLQRAELPAGTVSSLDDLRRLPILTKDEIRRHFHEMTNPTLGRGMYIRHSSSGTTGQKLQFLLTRELAYALNYANLWRFYSWGGIKLMDRRLTIGGRYFAGRPPFWVINRAENQLLLSIHHLNEHTVDSYIEQIAAFAPRLVQGHPSGLHALAVRMIAANRKVRCTAVFTTGETLTEEQRADLECAFGAKVLQTYGLGENVFAASECEYQMGYHEASELGIMELIPDSASGRYCPLGTSLWNTAMPFLRYRVEDIVEPSHSERCACGRTLPLRLRAVVGRIDDSVRAADGHTVLAVTIRMLVKPHLKPFENYQLQQIGPGRFLFCGVGDFERERRERIAAVLHEVLGRSARIEFAGPDAVLRTGGKIRNVVRVPT